MSLCQHGKAIELNGWLRVNDQSADESSKLAIDPGPAQDIAPSDLFDLLPSNLQD